MARSAKPRLQIRWVDSAGAGGVGVGAKGGLPHAGVVDRQQPLEVVSDAGGCEQVGDRCWKDVRGQDGIVRAAKSVQGQAAPAAHGDKVATAAKPAKTPKPVAA